MKKDREPLLFLLQMPNIKLFYETVQDSPEAIKGKKKGVSISDTNVRRCHFFHHFVV